ncbi:putative Ig domain-containing protein [Geotalea daltonii]|uniref:putative Ig domain-containing protein n=1 Tax=Geotalea daltonii TaxID=1203471 RepID=UPI0018A82ADF|nr:putative Ig domain-containing protein [Geotalea daltonii]
MVSHQKNTEHGFSATVFQSKDASSQYVLAIRGTETGTGTIVDDLINSDGGDLVRDGLALDQIVDLYNYWQQLTSAKGSVYQAAVFETLTAETVAYNAAVASGPLGLTYIASLRARTDIVIDEPTGQVRKILFVDSNVIYSDSRSQGLGVNPASVTVVGHSLGGHLAAAFSRLFPTATTGTLMINGAGYGDGFAMGAGGNGPSNVNNLFSMLNGTSSFDSSNITNLVGSAGMDFVAQDWWIGLHQPGSKLTIQTESANLSTTFGHGSSQMTDSMAIYDLLFRLDTNLAARSTADALARLESTFKSSSPTANNTFESIVNTLSKLLVSANATPIPIANREALYARIKQIRTAIDSIPAGSVTVDPLPIYPVSTIINMAKGIDLNTNDSLAYRYALKELNPFAVRGLDYSNANKNGELNLLNMSTGQGSLSEAWIADRAAMLSWIIQANTLDQGTVPTSFSDGSVWHFSDLTTGKSVRAGQGLFPPRHYVIFGKEGADTITGGEYADRFYGAGGNDAMYGYGGNDYLEGGKGDDTLYGGKGNDILYGGQGYDTYIYNIGDGTDTIVDQDNLGRILIRRNGQTIQTGTLYSRGNNIWTDASGKVLLTHNSPWRLVLEDGGIIELGENFQDGDFGLDLTELPANNISNTILGDYTPVPAESNEYQYDAIGIPIANAKTDSLGNIIYDATAPSPTRRDYLYDSAGNDLIKAGGGSDIINATRGGDNIIEGGSGSDIVADYGNGNNVLFGEFQGDMADLVSAGETAEGINEKGDLVSSGSGNDQLYGSIRNDALFGGGGNDLLVGGGGNDTILADAAISSASREWNVNNADFTGLSFDEALVGGIDNIYGGSGNDIIYAGGGNDSVDGGIGNDNLYGEGGNDSITGGGGDDFIQGDADWQALDTHGNDYIDGGAGNDRIAGLGGNDEVFGGDGNDVLQGNDGDDYLDGEAGDDLLVGNNGNDQLMGGDGLDEMAGNEGDDYLDGEAGDDKMYGDDGKDELFGGDGNDWLEGNKDGDYLDGEDGDDVLLGGEENDRLFGGEGNDRLQGDMGDDYLDGEAGNDNLMGLEGNDRLFGGDGNDLLQGGAGDDYFDGGNGDDELTGEAGDNRIFGGSGNDRLQGGVGNDYLNGGEGDDNLYGGDGTNVLVGGSGNDTYYIDPTREITEIYDNFNGDEQNTIKVLGDINLDNVVTEVKDGKLTLTLRTKPDNGNTGGNSSGTVGECASQLGDPITFYIGNEISYAIYDLGYTPGPMTVESALMQLGLPLPGDNGGYLDEQQLSLDELVALSRDQNEVDFCRAGSTPPSRKPDPLLVDLDGDGIETTRINTTTYFDHDANGTAERTAWIGKDDGLLVMDRNGDGIINNGRELFGDNTLLRSGSLAGGGFAALTDLDSNKDGKIDATDPGFDRLRVWQDGNGDAVSTPDELIDLYTLGIKEIALATQSVNALDGKGNTIVSNGTFTREDGSTSTIAEYRLKRNLTHTISAGGTAGADEVATLPELKGSGNLIDLSQAMAGNPALKTLVGQFLTEGSATARAGLMEQILFTWSGADSVTAGSRGWFIDARKVAFIEAYMGREFTSRWGSSPNDQAAILLDNIYQRVSETSYAQLMMQTHLQDLYSQVEWKWDDAQQRQVADLSQVTATIAETMATDAEAGRQLLTEFARTWRASNSTNSTAYLNFREYFINMDPDLAWMMDTGGLTATASSFGTNRSEALDGRTMSQTYLSSGDGDDVLYAGSADTKMFSNGGDSLLVGGTGNDYLVGGEGSDVLEGGNGYDILTGGAGNDTYIFRRGTGIDSVSDYGISASQDVIYVGDFITAEEVSLRRTGDDLVLTITDSGDRMVVKNWFWNDTSQVERIQFADGTFWNVDTIKKKVLQGTENADILTGYESDDTITGLDGNDLLKGGAGNDSLDGGTGNDYLSGGSGNDTYLFGRGSGSDVIEEVANPATEQNIVQLGDGVGPDDLEFMVTGEDLFIAVKNSNDQLQIKGWFAAEPARIEELHFADGTVWDRNAILSMMAVPTNTDDYLAGTPNGDLLNGGGGYDSIYGFGGNDILIGGSEDDYIVGGQGNDTLDGGAGYDDLYDNDGTNRLSGGADEDYLEVAGGVNELDGGADSDRLLTTAGSNTIFFRRGDGFDYVETYLTSAYTVGDAVIFGEGIRPEDLSIQINDSSISGDGYGGEIPTFVPTAAFVDGAYGGGFGSSVQLAIGIGNDEGMLITGTPADTGYGGGYGGTILNLHNLSIQRFVFADGRELSLADIIGMADEGVIGYQTSPWWDKFLLGSVANDEIYGNFNNDKIDARDYDDYLNGQYGDDALSAGSGQDDVFGGDGDDVLAGGRGDDYLSGGFGNDVYAFNRGDGHDYIDNYPGTAYGETDTISFGVDILPADIRATIDTSTGNLVLSIAGTDDNITIPWTDPNNGFATLSASAIARVQFIDAGGSNRIFDLAGLIEAHKDELVAAATTPVSLFGADADTFELTGTVDAAGWQYAVAYAQTGDLFAEPNYLYGSWGNDTITGRAGDDTLEGGYGDDRLAGGSGDDTYAYYQWDGNDTIDDVSTPGDPNSLLFGYGITPDDITLSHDKGQGQLILNILTTGETIRINHFVADDPYGPHAVEYFKFDDGTVLTWSQMIDKGFDIIGSSWDDDLPGTATTDRISGNEGNDFIAAGRGDDILAGGNGDDFYHYNPGDGIDRINDLSLPGEENTLAFGEGIALPDITQRLTYRDNTLIIRVGDGGDEIHLSNFDPNQADSGPRAIQTFTFADGTSITYEDLVKNTFILQGDTTNDAIRGTNLSDRLYGYEGSDWLDAGEGNDTLTSGTGDDELEGGTGNDAYVFNLGDGVDTISDSATLEEGNIIHFGAGITAADLRTRIDGNTLVIEYGNGGDAIILDNYDYSGLNGSHVVEHIEFADGSIIRLASLVDPGTEGNDLIFGTPFDDVINAKGGDDEVYGLAGNDHLSGGTGSDRLDGGDDEDIIDGGGGNDTLTGGKDFDTYLFNIGDGSDVIVDAADKGIGNIAAFGTGITRNDVSLTVDGNDLLITYGGSGDQIRVINYNPTGRRSDLPVSALQFADGSTMYLQELINQAPAIGTSLIDQSATEDTAFTLRLPDDAFIDPEGLPMSYRLSGPGNAPLPSWIIFNPVTRTLNGTPGNGDVGIHEVVVTAYDDLGTTSRRSFFVTVQNTNDAPVVVEAIPAQNVLEDSPFSYRIPAAAFDDIDAGDSLTLSAALSDGAPLPAWLQFDAATGTFSGTPGNDDVGSLSINVTATDLAGAAVDNAFDLTVENANDAPVAVTPLTPQNAVEDLPFSYSIPADTFNDMDKGDSLTLSATLADGSALPAWLQFDAATGTFTGTPDNSNVGAYQLSVTATDLAGAAASTDLGLTVANVNDAPVVNGVVTDQVAQSGHLVSFAIPTGLFADVDKGDILTISGTNGDGSPLPAWLTYDQASGTMSGTPDNSAIGSHTICLTATDQAGAQVDTSFTMEVLRNRLPIAVPDTAELDEDGPSPSVTGNVLANDSDPDLGDVLTVADPGVREGEYGYLGLSGDGRYGYILDNLSEDVQSLGRSAQVTEHFDYTVTDGEDAVPSSLEITIRGKNDAPILEEHLDDRRIKKGKEFSFSIDSDSFEDADEGDALTYTATLADGTALPDWLKFDGTTGIFSGTAPKTAGYLDIKVTATDMVEATGSTEGSLSVSDTFELSFGKSRKESDDRRKDDHREDKLDWMKKAGPGHREDEQGSFRPGHDDDHDHGHDRRRSEDHSVSNGNDYLDRQRLDDFLQDFDQPSPGTDREIATRWQAVSDALKEELADFDNDFGNHRKQSGDFSFMNYDHGSGFGRGIVDSSLLTAGSGTELKDFKGLKEGLRRLG